MSSTDPVAAKTPVLVCLAGGDASGKSTQVNAVRDVLVGRGVDVAIASIWDGLEDPLVSAALPFADRAAVREYLSVLSPSARTHFLFHAMQVAMDCAHVDGPDLVLINAYWYKYFATEVAHGGDPVRLRCCAGGFEEPLITCYLRTSVGTAMRRRTVPSDYESGYGGAGAFRHVQTMSRRVLDGLADELGWTVLDGELDEGVVTASIMRALDSTWDLR